MEIEGQARKVTIYIGESDKWQRKPLYIAILEMLKAENCAGATVTRALAGFGAHSRIHTATIVALSADLPLIIEWVDNPARVERVMPRLREMIREGLMTVQTVEVAAYTHRGQRELLPTARVEDVMSREVHTVRPDTLLADAVELLLDKIYRALPVVDNEDQVVGILTEGDLLTKVKLRATSVQQQLTEAEMAAELQRLRQTGQTVTEVMTPNLLTIPTGTTVAQAVKLMSKNSIKRLPVVDDEGHLAGIVSRVDVLRALSRSPLDEERRHSPGPGQHRTVGEMMAPTIPTVQATTPLTEVVDRLVKSAQRRVVVIDEEEQVVGIITDGDLIKRATAEERSHIVESLLRHLPLSSRESFHLSERTAVDVMTTPVVTVTPETSLTEALHLLLLHRIKRLPVVDGEGRPIGLVGRSGILQVMAATAGS